MQPVRLKGTTRSCVDRDLIAVLVSHISPWELGSTRMTHEPSHWSKQKPEDRNPAPTYPLYLCSIGRQFRLGITAGLRCDVQYVMSTVERRYDPSVS
jgi:hypothetical protein